MMHFLELKLNIHTDYFPLTEHNYMRQKACFWGSGLVDRGLSELKPTESAVGMCVALEDDFLENKREFKK